jgi:hypothetical protein
MAELNGINSLLSNISGQLGVLSAGIVANGEQIKRVPVEVIDANKKLALDTPNQLKSALCEEFRNGECFPSAMDRWIGNQPLSKVPNQIGALTPIVVNTGSIVNNQNTAITNLGNQVNNQNTAITNLGNQVNNQNTATTNVTNAVNNQNTEITNLGNQINNQNNAIANVTNTVNNISIKVHEIEDIVKEPCQILGWIEVDVPTVICSNKEGVWTAEIKEISVKVLATEDGDEAAQVVNSYQEIAKSNTALCLAKNKEEKECYECYSATPDAWLIRPEHHRPQLIFQFGEILPNGKSGSPKYEITIPHPKPGYKPTLCPIPNYTKGNWEIIYVLKDNSKITLHAVDKAEGLKVLNACKSVVNPEYLKGAYLSKDGNVETAEPLAKIKVKGRMAKFFPTGRKESKPEWVIHYD